MSVVTSKAPAQGGPSINRLIPVPKWKEHHDWPPEGGLRWMVFHAKTNGFDRVIKRVGRRVLIDEAAFFQWIEDQNASTQRI